MSPLDWLGNKRGTLRAQDHFPGRQLSSVSFLPVISPFPNLQARISCSLCREKKKKEPPRALQQEASSEDLFTKAILLATQIQDDSPWGLCQSSLAAFLPLSPGIHSYDPGSQQHKKKKSKVPHLIPRQGSAPRISPESIPHFILLLVSHSHDQG